MMEFFKKLPDTPTFVQQGLKGFQLPLGSITNTEVYVVYSSHGHDDYVKSKSITHLYYVLEGEGSFEIDEKNFPCKQGDVIEIPPGHEFTFSGNLDLLLILSPPFAEGEIKCTRPNPVVIK